MIPCLPRAQLTMNIPIIAKGASLFSMPKISEKLGHFSIPTTPSNKIKANKEIAVISILIFSSAKENTAVMSNSSASKSSISIGVSTVYVY